MLLLVPQINDFYEFSPNKQLCVVDTIKAYFDRSKPWRGETKNQLLLSSVKPHNEVTSSTISGWVKAILKAAGIDTYILKANFCRAASTSKAKVVGLSLEGILERKQWSGKSTWQKYYHKPMVNSALEYQNSVFSRN